MGDNTKIEWTDATWNVINGCSVVSPGCKHCYAMKQAHRFPARRGLTEKTAGGMVWTGEVRFNEAVLDQPLRWRRPRMIFVCAHGDLFHENVQPRWIDKVFAVMAACPQHTFQVLTKRPERMLEYATQAMGCGEHWLAHVERSHAPMWPLPNVWIGTSVEDQQRANERIPILLATPAEVRWLSMEPLLGPVDLDSALGGTLWIGGQRGCGGKHHGTGEPGCPRELHHHHDERCGRGLDWIVAGGESGPKSRPMHPAWVRSIAEQCKDAGVPFFFKQWGDWAPGTIGLPAYWVSIDGKVTNAWDALPAPTDVNMVRVGKKVAGRALDGLEYNGYPA